MSTLFKVTITQHWLTNCWFDADGNRCPEGTPGARFVDRRRVKPGTTGAKKVKRKSTKWYGRVPGKANPVPLSSNKVAAQQMLAAMVNKVELGKVGIHDPYEQHRKRPLLEHLSEWQANLLAGGATFKHVRQSVECVRRVLNGCHFAFIADLSASALQRFLAVLRDSRSPLNPMDKSKAEYTKVEAAAAVGIKPSAMVALIRRHRFEVTGNGRARRFPRVTVEALRARRGRGRSIKTTNLYLDAVKQFAAWLVQDRRAASNPLVHLNGGNVKVDRRHDRQTLTAEQLRLIVQVARCSKQSFRELSGTDRAMIYSVACASGFRAAELASLTPVSFGLDADTPAVTLTAGHAKNGQTAVQPLPPDVADSLRSYLKARPKNQPVWPGTWFMKAADMLRIDLDAAGILYVVEGPDGVRYADFHSLRHAYIAMLDRSGATLKEAMQLARHSDPKLTMAVYGRAQLHDLGEAVNRLPSLSERAEESLADTGTDPRFARGFAQGPDRQRTGLIGNEVEAAIKKESHAPHNPLTLHSVAAECESMKVDERSSPRGTLFVTMRAFDSFDLPKLEGRGYSRWT